MNSSNLLYQILQNATSSKHADLTETESHRHVSNIMCAESGMLAVHALLLAVTFGQFFETQLRRKSSCRPWLRRALHLPAQVHMRSKSTQLALLTSSVFERMVCCCCWMNGSGLYTAITTCWNHAVLCCAVLLIAVMC